MTGTFSGDVEGTNFQREAAHTYDEYTCTVTCMIGSWEVVHNPPATPPRFSFTNTERGGGGARRGGKRTIMRS